MNRGMDAASLVGIINATPDSFSDGGRFLAPAAAAARARELEAAGAAFLDIGAESTRPGHMPVGEAEELRRLLPVLEAVRGATGLPLSVDTRKAGVMRAAIRAGAGIVNDVEGLRNPEMLEVARESGLPVILMRPAGVAPREMAAFFRRQLAALGEGARVMLDPGVGFGTTREEDRWLLEEGVPELAATGLPVLVGVSRKRIVRHLHPDLPVEEASARVAVAAWRRGATHLRMHDFSAVKALLAREAGR